MPAASGLPSPLRLFAAPIGATKGVGRPGPGENCTSYGVPDDRCGLIRGYGLREIGAGVGLLLASRPAPWLWARVAGDLLDLGTLRAARGLSSRTRAVDAALAGVAAVTALDVAAASRLQRN